MANAQSQISILFDTLLTNSIIKKARSSTAAVAHGFASRHHERAGYIIRVLEAPENIQLLVCAALEASDSEDQHQIANILRMFLALSAAKKAKFIITFKVCANLVAEGLIDVAMHRVWQDDHIPPQMIP